MKNQSTRYTRPALWGFFICIIIACVLALVRLFVPSFVAYRWDSERTAWRIRTEQVIHEAFQSRVDQLTRIAEQALTDTSLTTSISLNDFSASLQTLNSYRLQDGQTIELVNLQENVLAWNGPSIANNYSQIIGQSHRRRFVRVTQNGLRTYLTVGLGFQQDRFYLMMSEPLELNSPISNRFVQKVSFCAELSEKLKTNVALRLPQIDYQDNGAFRVPIIDQEKNTIAEFSVAESSLDSEIASIVDLCAILIALSLACGSLLLACAFTLWTANKHRDWITTVVCILSLWFVRLIWREMDFPSNLIGGWLFNPNLYASSFALGLSSSLGELILSTITVVISSWLFLRVVLFNSRNEDTILSIGYRIGRIGAIALTSIGILLLLWLFRGFDEALRSFVFDSTIRYSNPSEILLEGTAALMNINILLLGVSFLCISTSLLWIGRKLISSQFPQEHIKIRIIIVVLLILCTQLFAFFDETPQTQLFSSILFVVINIVLVELILSWSSIGLNVPSQKWRIAVWMILSSFLIGMPILHQKLQQKEHKEVEVVANEYLRPSDSWLTNVVQDGLRVSTENLTKELLTNRITTAKETNLAFVLWTKTLLGKEGYNSALVLYDSQGNEVDRFVVGMSKLEQKEILTRVFEGEEDVVHVLGQTEQKMFNKLYGAWITIRDSSGQLSGSLALLLLESKKNIFHEEEIEPLRQFEDRLENNITREIAIHEFQRDTLVFSTGRKLYPNRFIPIPLENELRKTPNVILWKDITINGYNTQTVFVKDTFSPDRIAAVSLEELDFRWDLFSYLKEFFICLFILMIIGVYALVQKRSRSILPSIGFRGKLLFGFACITLLPLAALSYYNKMLVAEQVKEQIETTLYRELNQLQDRINTYVSDEEDFLHGVDDDFCEALTTEYGIDFSIYRGAYIQASSCSELYKAALLDGRLSGEAYAAIILDGKSKILTKDKIGSVEYVVGYAPLSINGNVVGVLAIPTLNRQKEIESELAQRNAYVFGAYAIVFGIALAGGSLLAFRFTRPLHQLTRAAKDVSEGNLDVSVAVISRDEVGILAQSFNEMISKLRKSRMELAKHERESAWKEMAKQVAHEIRNPLTPIKLSIQHLRQAFKDKAPDREAILQRVTQTVIDQIETLSRIASEFSNFAKISEGKFERLNIDDLLKATVNLFREVRGITFINQFASSSVTVVADSDQLRGVFINIIRNAIQAINKAGEITIKTSVEGRLCIIRISDTGQGMTDETLKKIFEPNFSTKTEGMGLGLAIAKRVIEDHGGTISCISEYGKGTTFEIKLPI